MKGMRFHDDGGREVLRYEQAPDPVPRPTEVLLSVRAIVGGHTMDGGVREGRAPAMEQH